jgi:hypothetical protein
VAGYVYEEPLEAQHGSDQSTSSSSNDRDIMRYSECIQDLESSYTVGKFFFNCDVVDQKYCA